MKNFYRPYVLSILFITLWWGAAFFSHERNERPSPLLTEPASDEFPSPLTCLSPMKRQTIKEALSGDVSLITKLITDWDLDAKILKAQGFTNTQRLPEDLFLRALTLGRHLKKHPDEELQLNSYVFDDCNHRFTPKQNGLVPQTFVAATFLLALTEQKNIVALPNGFTQQKLFLQNDTSCIPEIIDRFHQEELALLQPKLAFISPYSHPSHVQAMKNQGIELFILDTLDTLEKIPGAIKKVGDVVSCPLKAELLNAFIAATFLAIDNRVRAMPKSDEKVMLVNFYSRFSLPAKRSLSQQLLRRLQLTLYEKEYGTLYTLAVCQEEIASFSPDTLLVATPGGQPLDLSPYPKLTSLPRVHFIDDTVQQSPTQWIALAYYDLCKALWLD